MDIRGNAVPQQLSRGKNGSFEQIVLGQLDIQMQKNAVGPLLHTI